MPINFLQLLQESGNFMRNQRGFVRTAFLLYFSLSLIMAFITPSPASLQSNSEPLPLPILLAISVVNIWLAILMLLNIKAISLGNYRHFFTLSGTAFSRIFPVFCLLFIVALPFGLGIILVSFGSILAMSTALSQASIITILIALPLFVMGIVISLKLCLAHYIYLLDEPQKGVGESLKFAMTFSRGKMKLLSLYALLFFVLPLIIGQLLFLLEEAIASLVALDTRIISSMIGGAISSIIAIYLTIFSFRFYQAYRSLQEK